MRTDYKLDNRKVVAPNATWLGKGRVVKRGDCFIFSNGSHSAIARSLGRLTTTGGEDKGTVYVLAMVLAQNATHAFVRWVNPIDIEEIMESPAKLTAFFFAPELPYDNDTLLRLMDYGTTCERYIDKVQERIDVWQGKE